PNPLGARAALRDASRGRPDVPENSVSGSVARTAGPHARRSQTASSLTPQVAQGAHVNRKIRAEVVCPPSPRAWSFAQPFASKAEPKARGGTALTRCLDELPSPDGRDAAALISFSAATASSCAVPPTPSPRRTYRTG